MEERPCRACGCPLIFAEGPNGKPIPLDKKATVYAIASGRAVKLEGVYVSHFATCPRASEFSKKKSPERQPGQEG